MSLCDSLVDSLEEHLGFVPLDEFTFRVAIPSKYLASHLWSSTKEEIHRILEIKTWLKKVTRKVMVKGHPLEWTTPMGWPMRIADREPQLRNVKTLLFGQKTSMNLVSQPFNAPLSATQANKGVCANWTHSFDACFVHWVVCRVVELGWPLLTNHDCFACHASNAEPIHRLLHDTFRDLYIHDWLADIKEEIQTNTGVSLPKIPYVNDLSEGLLGTNPYLFS